MIDDQNLGAPVDGEQPEENNVPQREDLPSEDAAQTENIPAEAAKEEAVPSPGPGQAFDEGAQQAPETAEPAAGSVEAGVPSVEEPVYEEEAFSAAAPQEPVPAPDTAGAVPENWDPAPEAAAQVPPVASVPPEAQGFPPQNPYYPQGAYFPYQNNGGYAPYQQPYGYPAPGQSGPSAGFYQPPQPAPQQPQQGYYSPYPYPQQPYGYGTYPVQPARPPKKKMSTGLKVFIIIASILAGVAILGFGGYLVYSAAANSATKTQTNGGYSSFDVPGDWNGALPWEKDGGGEDDVPDFDDGVEPPEVDENDPVTPDVDVTPNHEGVTIEDQPEGEMLSAQEVYEKVVKSTVTVAVTLSRDGQEQTSTGTGIIATSDGYIITNSHVVLNSKSSVVEITTYDGQQYEAVVVGVDRTTDLAVLKTNDHNFTPAEFGNADQLSIGDAVVAIGNPGGAKFSGSMTGGYVSGLNREVGRYSENGMTYIQTDAAINPGNSGGPLVNMYGQVVGINSSKIITEGYEGMGFAIPVSKAKSVIDALLSGGYVKGRTRLGITGTEISEAQSMMYGVPQGFAISEINEESAFTGTEAKVGDVITAIDGEVVTGLTDISNLLARHAPGDKVTITLYRVNGGEFDVEATLLEDKGETQK